VVASFEKSNKYLGSVEDGEFLGEMSYYQLLKDYAPWIYLVT
jgi:hypothetical protein